MLLICPRCRTQFSAPDSAFAAGPRTVRCSLCKYTWRHPGDASQPKEKPRISIGTSSSALRPASASSTPSVPLGKKNPAFQPDLAPIQPEAASLAKQSALMPELKTPEVKSSEPQNMDLHKTITGNQQKAPLITESTESIAPEGQASGAITQKTSLEIQPENSPAIPAVLLSATTDAFSKEDRSFFETNYTENDAQAPVVTMNEARRSTQVSRQESLASPPKKRSNYRLAWIFCLLLFIALILAAWFWLGAPSSRQIATGQPINSAPARALEFRLPSFGLGKTIDGLEFYDVVAAYRIENGESQLVVEGEIKNISTEPKTLSPLRAVLFDDAGQPLADWIFDGGQSVLEGGGKLRFHTALNHPPTTAVNYEVAFTNSIGK